MDWLQAIDWLGILKCFIVGGAICVIGQILIDKTKLTSARILVIFVTLGAILGRTWNLPIHCGFCRRRRYCSSYWIWL